MNACPSSVRHALLIVVAHTCCLEEDRKSAGFGDFTLQQALEAISVKGLGKNM